MPIFSKQDLKRLIVPLIIEQVLAVTVGMADVMMVSSAGEAAVSGVSLVDMINVLIINVFAALATGGAVVASQLIGQQEPEEARKSGRQLIFVALVISVGLMGFCLIFQQPILSLAFGDIEADVMENALVYFSISAFSYPFLAVYNSCAALFRSMGNSRVSMVTSIWMNLINVAGNAICVFGFHMGAAGVALPSLISRAVACIAILRMIYQPRHIIHLVRGEKFHVDRGMIRKILRIGIPNGLENSIFQLGRLIVVSIIAGFGTVQIAANAVANTVDSMGCIPGQALGLAMITVVGQCVGARDYDQARFYIKKLMKLTYLITAILNTCLLLSLPIILSAYGLSDETLDLATKLIWIHNFSAIFLWPAAFTLPNALRASNDAKFTMIVSVFSMCVFRIGTSVVLGQWIGWGAIGVWIAMVMDWVFRIILFLWRYFSGKWQLQKI